METRIKKRLNVSVMQKLFDNYDLINIRFFKAEKFKKNDDAESYLYQINIRHNENEDPEKLLLTAIKKIEN